jgi:ABC-type nitrate/sulfonate/bicarbonate transport system substrate-binding protein
MKAHSRILAILGAAALSCLGCAPAALAQSAAPVTIKYAIPFPEVELMPLYAAQDQACFRDENLSVEVFALSSGDKITLALVSGSIDIAIYTPDWFVRAIEKGDAPIRIVIGGSNVPVYSLIAAKEIASYADLKGKRIAVSTVKASDAYLIRKMLAAHGLKEPDYALIQAGSSADRAAALKAGSVSATLMIPPFDQRMVDEEGFKRLDVSTSVITHYAWLSQAVRQDWARANKASLIGFIRCWIKGTRWLYDPKNKDAAIRILSKELKIENRFAQIAYDTYFASKTVTVAKDGEVDLVGLQEIINAIAEQGDISPPTPKPQKYLDLSYWEEAHKSVK